MSSATISPMSPAPINSADTPGKAPCRSCTTMVATAAMDTGPSPMPVSVRTPLGSSISRLQQRIKHSRGHARVLGDPMTGLDLTQDLGFADHQTSQRCRDIEQMQDRRFVIGKVGLSP